MATSKDEVSESGEVEDVSSDFFDDFTKDEFMEGLSVVDECWEDVIGTSSQVRESRFPIDEDAVNSVEDLRELIGDNCDDDNYKRLSRQRAKDDKGKQESPANSTLNKFIKPGSRRDPSKTKQAIKKDKEVKVQQFLAKTLESADNLRPPGTELDDYYENNKKKVTELDFTLVDEEKSRPNYRSRSRRSPKQYPQRTPRRSPRLSPGRSPRHSPGRSPRHSPGRSPRHSPGRSPRHSPGRSPRHSPGRSPRHSPGRGPRHSPRRTTRRQQDLLARRNSRTRLSPRIRLSPRGRHSPHSRLSPHARPAVPRRNSPVHQNIRASHSRYGRHGSPRRWSPVRRSSYQYSHKRHSPRRNLKRSRSPYRNSLSRRSRSSSQTKSSHHNDNFLYPRNMEVSSGYTLGNPLYHPGQGYGPSINPDHPGYYPATAPAYGGSFSDLYNYGGPHVSQVDAPGTVNMPHAGQVPIQPLTVENVNTVGAPPAMVPAPMASTDKTTPYDALAQLVAEGKISRDDYLKLTPHKGVATPMDTKSKVNVLSRCNQALSKLKQQLLLPNRLIICDEMVEADNKYLTPKFCSPLKRQAVAEFNFSKGPVSSTHQTKQLVDSIVSTLGLDRVISKYKRKLPKNMKDAGVQTIKPQCDICEIRESTKYHDVSTSTEPEYFTSSIHTQVVEQDLISSKSIFNPTGSVGDGAAISIAHLTPAQLVSQLAARAKTLKQPLEPPQPPNQFARRPPPSYNYDNSGGQYHHSYNNYRY